MTSEVQITRWRDLPSLVMARSGEEQVKVLLPPRYQEAIDEAAMRLGESSADDYLAGWARSAWMPHSAAPETAVAEVTAALEDEWDQTRIAAYLDALV